MCNLQYDLARFIPLESKVPTASYQVVTGGPPPPPPSKKKKKCSPMFQQPFTPRHGLVAC